MIAKRGGFDLYSGARNRSNVSLFKPEAIHSAERGQG
jgi:hypothetical protein